MDSPQRREKTIQEMPVGKVQVEKKQGALRGKREHD